MSAAPPPRGRRPPALCLARLPGGRGGGAGRAGPQARGGGGRSRRGLASAPGIFRARRDSWAVAASLALVGGSGAGDRLGRFSSAARLPGRAATALGGWKGGRSGNPDLVPGGGAAATLPGWRRLRCVRVPAGLRRRGEPAGGKREEETGARARFRARARPLPALPPPPSSLGPPRGGRSTRRRRKKKIMGGCWAGGRRPEGGC